MPSFSFWKSSKTEELAREPLLATHTTCDEVDIPNIIIPKNLDLDPGKEDSGVFLFDELDLQPPTLCPPQVTAEVDGACTRETFVSPVPEKAAERIDSPLEGLVEQSPLRSRVSEQCVFSETAPEDPPMVAMDVSTTTPKENNYNVQMSKSDDHVPSSQPTAFTPSMSPKQATPGKPATHQQKTSIARLRRPAELNLATNTTSFSPSQPCSELEQRYALIRNSKTQSKAALRSPTALLEERLNLTPKKTPGSENKVRIFTPPQTPENGCWIPGPGGATNAFTSSSIRACTEKTGRPAWWCKFDKLVVFDGIDCDASGEMTIRTRTSKGLSIARRKGDLESIVIPLDCSHCQEMLNRHEWKYDMRVCKRSVCWDCKERCKWEAEEEKRVKSVQKAGKAEGNRFRADSLMQE
ncbi:hypothetical protein COCC4DRAFT_197655 [Bipolaris maydis ATCC 48331]|uniref:Uncharacterized protein n=2 Tax=Cochliobolus heterostrophus TaxID=5016 RepID=M2VC91_COCH5|nr:uncharacterized protein COCC4DRAFT_197655 [Bipolaris maydis ATCC 48331]EMD97313.1 hypothetical protein COCHEDRAFT_1164072 [Bipolaris maydis C5]KAJ5029737.1 hypothetical protein J3E73DRAFT_379604 [Bipolaris maydis]ENI04227.1 hypothetical protein COCC4DRAFT_197655 [Bipolaris maydis ATCC 48331]KAJ6275645.1 hypothetical protein PSV08DRAFT_406457 [Bipolaris maydis]KAJ6286796.1 hypothetical protein J3E71DRAFT_207707 [Bipolaris maydis]